MLSGNLEKHIRSALQEVLDGPLFRRSRRSRNLLEHLVWHGLLNGGEGLSELTIGLQVFARDPATYHPAIDPIVRVEIGRLRKRLLQHYALQQPHSRWRLMLPAGGYRPQFHYVKSEPMLGLALRPFNCLSAQGDAQLYTSQLNGLLRHQLHLQFGGLSWLPLDAVGSGVPAPQGMDCEAIMPLRSNDAAASAAGLSGAVLHLLDGHVRQEGQEVSTVVHLWAKATQKQLWSAALTYSGVPDEGHLNAVCQMCLAGVRAALLH